MIEVQLDAEFWRNMRRESLLGARLLRANSKGLAKPNALRLSAMERAMARHYKERELEAR